MLDPLRDRIDDHLLGFYEVIPNEGCIWFEKVTERCHDTCKSITDLISHAKERSCFSDVCQGRKCSDSFQEFSAWPDSLVQPKLKLVTVEDQPCLTSYSQ